MQQPQLDEKKSVIIPILNRLRQFNSEIGSYEKSILNSDFQYAVKLSNGRIILSQELVHDYEHSPAFITEDQFKVAATQFKSDLQTIPIQPASVPPVEKSNAASFPQTNYTSPKKENNSTLKRLLILGTIIVLALVGYYIYTQIDKQTRTAEVEDKKAEIRNNINGYVKAETNQYTYSKLGGIFNLVVTINNNTDYLLENVKIRLTYIKVNGEVWKNIDYDFQMLSPNSVGTLKVPDTDRGASVKCRVIAVKSSALGL